MNEMTRKLQKQIRSRCFGGPMPRKVLRPLKQGKLSSGFKKRMILESVPTKNWKPYENEEQFDPNAENLAIFKENEKEYEDA